VSIAMILPAALREVVAIEPGVIVTFESGSWVLLIGGAQRMLRRFVQPVSESCSDSEALRLVYRRAAEWLLSEATHCHDASVQALRVEIGSVMP
jgi:hypothetical protein